MSQEVLLSICIPTYNRADIVFECVKKCLELPYDEIEVVVVDDCSTDTTVQKLSVISDKRFHLYQNEMNLGYTNLGECLTKGKGKFCMLLSNEDEVIINDWESVRDQLINGTDVAVFQCDYFDSNNKYLTHRPQYKYKKNELETYLKVFHKFRFGAAAIYNRKILLEEYENIYKPTYLWSLYPQQIISLWCVKEGDYTPLLGIKSKRTDHDSQGYTDAKQWSGKSNDLPYWSIDGRLRQCEEWIDFFSCFPVEDKVNTKMADEALFSYLIQFKKNYDWLYFDENINDSLFFHKRPDIIEHDRGLSDEEWLIKLRESYVLLNDKIRLSNNSAYRENSDVHESALREAKEWLIERSKLRK